MRYECSSLIFVCLTLLHFSTKSVRGKSLGNNELSSTIKGLHHELKKVLSILDRLSQNGEKPAKGDKSRSGIPYDQGNIYDPGTTYGQGITNSQGSMDPQGNMNTQGTMNAQGTINHQGTIDHQGTVNHQGAVDPQEVLNHLLADESVIKATAKKAAKAVENSAKATLKTQKGVKKIAAGLLDLKKCLETFENTIKI